MRLATHPLLAAGISAAFAATLAAGGLALPATTLADSPASCVAAGDSGFTAAVVARSGQRLNGRHIDATGCDVGIYVGPDSRGTRITHSTVTGANDHGIFVQDASHVLVADNLVSGNGLHPALAVGEDKAIQLAGTSYSTVRGNVVRDNVGDGGIGVSDDGPAGPAAPNLHATASPARGNVISHNTVTDNLVGCGIVVASKNPGGGAYDNKVIGNRVVNTAASVGVFPPAVGGIVVAGPLTLRTMLVGNTIEHSFIPGINIHSSRPGGAVNGTLIVANRLVDDGWGKTDGPAATTAIDIAAQQLPPTLPQPQLRGTLVVANRISGEDVGICVAPTASRTLIAALGLIRATTRVERSTACIPS